MWANFHTHSNYCDGNSKLIDYLTPDKEVVSLGFSSHAPLPFPCSWCMRTEKLSDYLSEIESLKSSAVEVYKGLEVDFIPGIISPLQFADQLDYTIDSIHFVEKLSTGKFWEIDGQHSLFLQGLAELFNGHARSAIQRYFELTREMILTAPPTIIGHLDKIKIQNIGNKLFLESDTWYRHEIMQTLDVIEKAGTIVEVNTRGLYQKKSFSPYPSYWILELIYEKNIPITLSSDAHHASDITNQFRETAAILRKIGFRKLCVLIHGVWKQLEFNNYGLVTA